MMKTLKIMLLGLGLVAIGCSGQSKKSSSKKEMSKSSMQQSSKSKAKADGRPEAASSGKAEDKTTCTLNQDERMLEILAKGQSGCEVHYTKNTENNIVATADYDRTYCREVFDRIRGKLETAGFSCN